MEALTGHVEELRRGAWRLVANLPRTVRRGQIYYPRKTRTVRARGVRTADALLREWLIELEQRACTDPHTLTFAGMAGQWLDWVKENRRPATHSFYESQLRHHILPALGPRLAVEIEPKDLVALYASKRIGVAPLSEYSRRHIHATVKAAYSWACRNKLVLDNPARLVSDAPAQKAKRPRRTWDPDQIALAVTCAEGGRRNARNLVYLPMMLAGWSGLRCGEVCGLRWEDVDFTAGLLNIRRTLEQTPGGRLHVTPPKTPESAAPVPLPASLIQALREAHTIHAGLCLKRGSAWNPEGYVMVTRTGTPVKPSNLSSAWRTFCLRNDLPAITFHELRHSFATNLFDAGEDLITVQKLVRHSKASTTADIYLHKTDQQRRDAIERQDERIAAAVARLTNLSQPIRIHTESGEQAAV